MFSRGGMAFALIQNKMAKRKSHTRELKYSHKKRKKLSVSYDYGLNYHWHNGLWRMAKIFLHLQESLMWIENALDSGLNEKNVKWVKNMEADQLVEIALYDDYEMEQDEGKKDLSVHKKIHKVWAIQSRSSIQRFKGVAYPKTWNIPDERHRKHGSDTIALCDGRWKNECWQGKFWGMVCYAWFSSR